MEYIEKGSRPRLDNRLIQVIKTLQLVNRESPTLCMNLFPGTIWMDRVRIRVNGPWRSLIEYTRIVQTFREGNYWMILVKITLQSTR